MTLGDVTVRTEQRDPTKAPDDEFLYVDIAAVDNASKTIIGAKRITGADSPSRARKVIRAGDVIVSMVRPNLNAVALVSEELDNQLCSTGFSVLRPSEGTTSEYLFAFVRSPFFIDHLVARTTGANYPAVADQDIRAVPIAVPPLEVQRRLMKLLDEADELRKLRAQADRRMADLIPALFNEIFGDPQVNPFSWPLRSVGELVSSCDYGTSKKANEHGSGVPILRMGNVLTSGDLDLSDIKHVELSDSELNNHRLAPGDVLFNRTNSRDLVGKTGLWDGRWEAVAASYFIRVRFSPDIEHPQHFTQYMNLPSMKKRLASMARGAVGQANINGRELRAIQFPVPPIGLQHDFANKVQEIHAMRAEQAKSHEKLDALFQSMLHRAFVGKL